MRVNPFVFVLFSVVASAAAQIAFKVGMSDAHVRSALEGGGLAAKVAAVASNGHILGGFLLYGASVPLWLLALSRLEVGVAYPFVAVGIVITFVLGAVMLGESVGAVRIAGTMLVVAGVTLVAWSGTGG